MATFTLELAGIPVGVESMFDSTQDFCAEYVTDADPELHVVISEADLAAERVRAARQDEREGFAPRSWSDEYLETLALYRKAAELLLPFGVIVFHGAVVAVGERAYLFTAPSGTGKTTHVRYWLSQIPNAYVLNGDKPLLRASDEGVFAYGTPWQGKEGMGVRGCLPLAGLCLLERGETDAIRRIDFNEAMPTLIQQAYRPEAPDALVRIVQFVGQLGAKVSLWRMQATLDERSALVSYAAMATE